MSLLDKQTFVGTLHCALENGADLSVNVCQKIRHYRARSTKERRRIRRKRKNAKSRFFLRAVRHEINFRTRWWWLKCVIVYLARYIPAFVMYCINGASRLLLYTYIESTDSMIYPYYYILKNEQKVGMLLQKRADTRGVGIVVC